MHIAICEDELKQQEGIVLLLEKYKAIRPDVEMKLSVFSSGDELLGNLEEHGGYDLYILDIIMPKLNGIEVGIALRERQDEGLIIYLTVSSDFAVDSYQTQAFYYLLKPVAQDKWFHVLDMAYTRIEAINAKGITIKTVGGIMQLLPLHTILYAELIGRAVRYYLTDGKIVDSVTFRGSFQNEIAPLLQHQSFALCGASFAVNLRHVAAVRKVDILLATGDLVPVSRNLYSRVKKQWMLYWLERR